MKRLLLTTILIITAAYTWAAGVPYTGSVDIDEIEATGTRDNTTFLRGDGTFATPTATVDDLDDLPGDTVDDNKIDSALINAATDSAFGTVELSTDAESVTGTSDVVVVTPGTLTARLASPGPIGGTTPDTGRFTYAGIGTAPDATIGLNTAITASSAVVRGQLITSHITGPEGGSSTGLYVDAHAEGNSILGHLAALQVTGRAESTTGMAALYGLTIRNYLPGYPVTSNYGIEIQSPNDATNKAYYNYGLYLGDQTGVGTVENWAIYSDGAAPSMLEGAISAYSVTATTGGMNVPTGQAYNVNGSPHTHTGSTISGIDISDDTNLAGTANQIVLTGDTLSLSPGYVNSLTLDANSTGIDAYRVPIANGTTLYGKTWANIIKSIRASIGFGEAVDGQNRLTLSNNTAIAPIAGEYGIYSDAGTVKIFENGVESTPACTNKATTWGATTFSLGSATRFTIPSGTSVTTDGAGQIGMDTNGDTTNTQIGIIQTYDGSNTLYLFPAPMPLAASQDGYVQKYNASTGNVTWQADNNSGSNTTYTDIGDATGDATIALAGYYSLITSTMDFGTVHTIRDTDADLTGGTTTLLSLEYNDDGDADGYFINCKDNGYTDSQFSVGANGTISTLGTIELGHATDTTLSRSAAGELSVEGVKVTTESSTNTLTNKTLDANGTGNVIKGYGYLVFKKPSSVGAGVTHQTTATARTYGQVLFANATDEATNYVEYECIVPPDIDTSVDLTASFKFILSGADTADHDYQISMISIGDSEANSGSPANAVALAFTADGNGASGDVETATATLTDWRSNVTAGEKIIIRVARDGDDGTNDASTVDSYSDSLIIRYGFTQ